MSHQDIFSDGAGGMILRLVTMKCVAAESVSELSVLYIIHKIGARLILELAHISIWPLLCPIPNKRLEAAIKSFFSQ